MSAWGKDMLFFFGGGDWDWGKLKRWKEKKQISQLFFFPSCGGIFKDGGEKG